MSTTPVVETTLTGAKLWIIVGLLIFMGVVTLIGIYVPGAQEYVLKSIVWMQTAVGSVGAMK